MGMISLYEGADYVYFGARIIIVLFRRFLIIKEFTVHPLDSLHSIQLTYLMRDIIHLIYVNGKGNAMAGMKNQVTSKPTVASPSEEEALQELSS